jgi:hypothetical protein
MENRKIIPAQLLYVATILLISQSFCLLCVEGRPVGDSSMLASRVVDPHHFDADPDPACHFGADPDPVRDPACQFDGDPDR